LTKSTKYYYLCPVKSQHLKEIRAFNRFYTNIIGLLDKHILNSNYSLPEVRIMFELYHHTELTASYVISVLDIDKGYLSRILRGFEKNKLIIKVISSSDKRSASLKLTTKGKKEFEVLNAESDRQVKKTFESLTENECNELVQKMMEIRQILNRKK